VEEAFPLLWIFKLILLDFGGGQGGAGLRFNDLLSFVILLVEF